jgi:hypothetical protein
VTEAHQRGRSAGFVLVLLLLADRGRHRSPAGREGRQFAGGGRQRSGQIRGRHAARRLGDAKPGERDDFLLGLAGSGGSVRRFCPQGGAESGRRMWVWVWRTRRSHKS